MLVTIFIRQLTKTNATANCDNLLRYVVSGNAISFAIFISCGKLHSHFVWSVCEHVGNFGSKTNWDRMHGYCQQILSFEGRLTHLAVNVLYVFVQWINCHRFSMKSNRLTVEATWGAIELLFIDRLCAWMNDM